MDHYFRNHGGRGRGRGRGMEQKGLREQDNEVEVGVPAKPKLVVPPPPPQQSEVRNPASTMAEEEPDFSDHLGYYPSMDRTASEFPTSLPLHEEAESFERGLESLGLGSLGRNRNRARMATLVDGENVSQPVLDGTSSKKKCDGLFGTNRLDLFVLKPYWKPPTTVEHVINKGTKEEK